MSYVLCLLVLLSIFSSYVLAAPKYQLCTDQQTQKLIHQFKLNIIKEKDSYNTYTSCLNLNKNQQIIAISQPIIVNKNEGYAEYDLQLYLIDAYTHQILHHYIDQIGLGSDAAVLNQIKFDINAYSTVKDKNMIGLKIFHEHLGEMSFNFQNLYLFNISKKQGIQLILENFMTNFQGNNRPSTCDGKGISTQYQVYITPTTTLSYGLNDLILKENLNRQETQTKNCKTKTIKKQRSHHLKFNGKQYQFQHLEFLDYGI